MKQKKEKTPKCSEKECKLKETAWFKRKGYCQYHWKIKKTGYDPTTYWKMRYIIN